MLIVLYGLYLIVIFLLIADTTKYRLWKDRIQRIQYPTYNDGQQRNINWAGLLVLRDWISFRIRLRIQGVKQRTQKRRSRGARSGSCRISPSVMIVMADNVMWHRVGHRLCKSSAHHRLRLQLLPLGVSASVIRARARGYALSPQCFGGTSTKAQRQQEQNLHQQNRQQHDGFICEVVL